MYGKGVQGAVPLFPFLGKAQIFQMTDDGRIEIILLDGRSLARIGHGVCSPHQEIDDRMETARFALAAFGRDADLTAKRAERLNGERIQIFAVLLFKRPFCHAYSAPSE